jgi:SAM-dependent methyltransferase
MGIIKNRYINSADLYDLDQSGNPTIDIPFYMEYAKKQIGDIFDFECAKKQNGNILDFKHIKKRSGDILELGCGTGRVSIELAKAGYSVTGLDLSEQMLKIYRNKIKNLPKSVGEKIEIINGDMAEFHLDKKFSLIIAPFRAFQALTAENDVKNCLKCIKEHLSGDGIFIIDVFRPHKTMDESWRSEESVLWERDDEKSGIHAVKKECRERIDVNKQIIYPYFVYEVKGKNGKTERRTEYLELKYYYYEQLIELLESNDFRVLEEYGGYDKRGIESGGEFIIVVD